MLRYQLNPHFLFNTLNSISTLVLLKQTDRANAMLSRLSSFLRYTLVNESTGMVTVAQEIETLKLYLEIEKMRFEERLRPHFHIDPTVMRAHLPSLLLQPLIENAIKYAVTPQEEGADISIEARREVDRVLITVSDTGPGADAHYQVRAAAIDRRRTGEHSGPSGAGLWRQPPVRDTVGHHRGLPRFHRNPVSNRSRGAEMTIRTILVDDEPLAIQGLQLRLEPHEDVEIVDTCSNGREAIRSDQDPQARPRLPRHPDAGLRRLLGDPGADGGRAAAVRLRHRLCRPRPARVRGEAVDYLMKPVDEDAARRHARAGPRSGSPRSAASRRSDRLKEVLAEVAPEAAENVEGVEDAHASNRYEKMINIKDRGQIFRVDVDSIEKIDAAGDYMCIYTGDNTLILRETMKDLEKRLDPRRFQRVHRSTIVNLDQVRQVKPHTNGECFLVLDAAAR